MKLNAESIALIKEIETLIINHRTSIDSRVPDRELGLEKLGEFLMEQRMCRLTCDDILKKLRDIRKSGEIGQ